MDLPKTGSEARKLGIKKYFTGQPCKFGHIANRYSHNGQCTECGKKATENGRKKPEYKIVARKLYERKRKNEPEKIMFFSAIRRSKSRGVKCEITPQDIKDIWPQDNICPILGIEMIHNFDVSGSHSNYSPSLDSIDPSKGYVRGNIVICSFLANRIKNDVIDPNVFKKIATWLEKILVKGG